MKIGNEFSSNNYNKFILHLEFINKTFTLYNI